MSQKVKAKIVKDVTQLVLARRTKMCNFLEYKGTLPYLPLGRIPFHGSSIALTGRSLSFPDTKVIYRRYASLFFVCGISAIDNELVALEIVHRYVEVLDRYFGNVNPPTPLPPAQLTRFPYFPLQVCELDL